MVCEAGFELMVMLNFSAIAEARADACRVCGVRALDFGAAFHHLAASFPFSCLLSPYPQTYPHTSIPLTAHHG